MGSTRYLRRYRDADELAVVDVWYRAGRSVYTFLPAWKALTPEVATRIFRQVIRPLCEIWVAVDEGRIVGYLALDGSYLDRLYVDPKDHRKGWGSELVTLAKRRCPAGLTARTHQENLGAQALFERHGFEAVDFGVSPPPECAPDVLYQWPPRPPKPDALDTSWP